MTVLDLDNFETDFWKDVDKRKTWDEIIPGELRDTRPVTLSKEVIARYARGDGGIIAPPSIHILLMFACTTTEDWMRSPGTINAGQNWSYHVPIRPGDTITMRGTALDRFIRKDRLFAVHENTFTNQHDQIVCTGRGQTIRPA